MKSFESHTSNTLKIQLEYGDNNTVCNAIQSILIAEQYFKIKT